jgi:L-asparaginase II
MSNPVLVEVIRGGLVESRHRGAVAVADAGGALVLGFGDVAAEVFPRSAVKALQALPLVESGAAERYGLGDEELALACASHSGERAHVEGVTRMLAKAGLEPSALCCGRIGRSRRLRPTRWRARAPRRRCTTTARVSMRAFSPSPVRAASITSATGSPTMPCSAKCTACCKI